MTPELPDLRAAPDVIAVIGMLDSVGKTTTAVNLAVAFAAAGRVVLLIDLDSQSNIGNSLVRGWHEPGGALCLFANAAIAREMIAATEVPDLYLLPAEENLNNLEPTLSFVGDSRTRLAQSIETLRALPMRFDLILINCPSNLGLMTLNALVVAHWVLIPVPAMADAMLQTVLLTIQRLRDGMRQPLRGVYLLPALEDDPGSIADTLRSQFAPITLPIAIPWSHQVEAASQHGKPVLIYALQDAVSVAYLQLAAGWLALMTHGSKKAGTLIVPHSEESNRFRKLIEQRIRAWLVDPSCLLYDAEEAKQRPISGVVEDLMKLTHPVLPTRRPKQFHQSLTTSPSGSRRGLWIGGIGAVGIAFAMVLLLFAIFSLRIDVALWLIGPAQSWNVGSVLLFRADPMAYRELMLGAKLIGHNRTKLLPCEEEAQAKGTVVNCTLVVSPE